MQAHLEPKNNSTPKSMILGVELEKNVNCV